MSVIVKGIDFPKCCADCDFELHDEYGLVNEGPLIYKGYNNKIRTYTKLDDCPLVEIPEGARLIDKRIVKRRMVPLDFSVQNWISEVDLDLVPTVFDEDES